MKYEYIHTHEGLVMWVSTNLREYTVQTEDSVLMIYRYLGKV
jgi:hypothetical protein